MEQSWKPKGWVVVIVGLVLQPFVFLYVNRLKLFWFYGVIAMAIGIANLKNLGSLSYNGLNLGVFAIFAMACVIHGYWCARNYDTSLKRSWFASLIGTLGAFAVYLLAAFLLRSTVIEPYSLPSSSMEPNFTQGNKILVTKWGYGNYSAFGIEFFKMAPSKTPQRGDVIVFQYPEEPDVDYVKRVVALPGDTITYNNKQIYIKPSCQQSDCPEIGKIEQIDTGQSHTNETGKVIKHYQESLGEQNYGVWHAFDSVDYSAFYFVQNGVSPGQWKVPPGHYFVMGDNRDNSRDSRFWGFVPQKYVKGKVILTW